MVKHKCGECKNFVPIKGVSFGICKIRKYLKSRKQGIYTEREFRPNRTRIACKDGFEFDHELTPEVRICRYCGKEFVKSKNGPQYFCSEKCRNKWYSSTRRKSSGECIVCGKELTDRRRKYCSAKCKAKARALMDLDGTIPSSAQGATQQNKRILSISEINAIAHREHLSYGQVVNKYGL